MTLGSRYRIDAEVELKYSPFITDEIKWYNGFDNLHNRPVLIKSFDLPRNENAQRLAIALWEREIRLTRKAMGSKGGNVLLKLLDASFDEKSGKLYVISAKHGHSLVDWITGSEDLWFLENFEEKSRKEIWNLFFSLLSGIEALHSIKLIHRNINPDTLYYSERSDFEGLKLGGITWSLYLHNLNFIPKRYKKRRQSFSIFQAPESFGTDIRTSSKANPFVHDIYSLGMVLCYIFYEDFPEFVPNELEEWENQLKEIYDFFSSSNHPLGDEEAQFLLKCVSTDPSQRPKTVSEAKRIIQGILSGFDVEDRLIEERLKVNWYNQPDSWFLRDIGRYTSIPVDQLMENPNEWLATDFKDSQLFATGLEEYPLVITNNTDHMFGLKPIYLKKENRENKDILQLFMIMTRKRRSVLRAIQDKAPINILKNGLQYIPEHYRSDPLSGWRRILGKAESEIKTSREEETEEVEFIESLKLMLDAEKHVDSKKILQFKRIKVRRNPEEKIEIASVIVSSDLTKDLKKWEKREVYDKINEYRNSHGGMVELSVANTPASSWDNGREWRIKKLNKNNLHLTLERDIKKKNKNLDEEGVVRPFEMNVSLSLYRRKERVIEDVKGNELILSALLDPKVNTFYLGLDSKGLEMPISDIINTIPLYLVQGPPGTGKTWTASSVVSTILNNDPYARILISSKDHEPLDHLVEAIIEKINPELDPQPIVVRSMSPEREREYDASDTVLEYNIMTQTNRILKGAQSTESTNNALPDTLKDRWRDLIRENLPTPSLKWLDEIQKVANVLFATSTSSTVEWLNRNAAPYDYVVVEEAAKSYPTELLLPMNLGHRWLLIGDQKQLPPYMYDQLAETVSELLDEEQIRKEADDDEFYEFREKSLTNIKLFEKLFDTFKEIPVLFSHERYSPCVQLNNQWRLPPLISNMIAEIFYETEFESKQTAPEKGDPFSTPPFLLENQLIWIDTPLGAENHEFQEYRTPEGSIINRGEIRIVIDLIQKLKLTNQREKLEDIDIVILTPYLAQKTELARTIFSHPFPQIKSQKLRRVCHTVDSFQGRQADIVIISLVRNNDANQVKQALGFLTATERLNVMFSRVKKRMIIIGCSQHLLRFKNEEESNAITQVLEYVSKHGIITNLIAGKEGE